MNKLPVKAKVSTEYPDDGELGLCYKFSDNETCLVFNCPGCGRTGGISCTNPKQEKTWKIDSGSIVDPTTLTLSPSINCVGCCGWHGYLKNGIFEHC